MCPSQVVESIARRSSDVEGYASNGRGAALPAVDQEDKMVDAAQIKEHSEVIGADGAHIGTVDRVEGDRIKLTKSDSGEGSHEGHHHFIPLSLVAEVEGNQVRLSANADVAVTFEQEQGGESTE
jgi:hypothetical protein